MEDCEIQKIWREYYEDLYNIDTQEQVAVYICGFDGVRRGNYFVEERPPKLRYERAGWASFRDAI